jgi:hypothetical protein
MIPASFYQYGPTSRSHPVPVDPRQLRDAAVVPSFLRGLGCGADTQVRRVGQLGGLGAVGETLPTVGYAAAAIAGSALGGALIGWVASDSRQGAYKGAGFAAGMVGVADGFATFRTSKAIGATLMLGGLGGIWWALRGKIGR